MDETEIFQICECVRYFVANRRVLSMTEIHIKKHNSITQISLKNFAWNIAFQYNIGRDMTTSFVMATFSEWFANSTFDTVRKICALLLDVIRLKLTKISYQNTLSNPFLLPDNNYYRKLFILSDNLYKFALGLKHFTSWLI